MKGISTFVLFSLAVLGLASCGDTTGNTSNTTVANSNANRSAMNSNSNGSSIGNAANSVSNSISNAASALTVDSPDDFMQNAAQSGLAEVELGRLASTKGTNAEVKKFGQMMVAEHTKANTELKGVAGKKNVTLPNDLGSHQSTLDELKGLSGADFDKAYVEAMVDAHESDVKAFQAQADKSADPDVKAFAAKSLPVLQKHLEAVKALNAKVNP